MFRASIAVFLFGFAGLASFAGGDKTAPATEKDAKDKTKVAGILIDRDNRNLKIRADGDDEIVKYVLPERPDAKLAATLKGLFNVQRVQITYELKEDVRVIKTLARFPGLAKGTVTGTVIAVHNDFWVEVKPKVGVPEGFASGDPVKSRDIVAMLKILQPGDIVTIRYHTDFERHRIETIKKIETKK